MQPMNLSTYFYGLDAAGRKAFVKKAGTTQGYIPQLVGRHRTFSAELAMRLHKASSGAIDLNSMRPDLWKPGWVYFIAQDSATA